MPRFAIYSSASLVGSSELELGDAPMGVAFGSFFPAAGYAAIQSIVVAAAGGPLPEDLQLSVRDSNGEVLEASGGVHIADYSADLGQEGLEVSILGVPYPAYESLFPQHVAAYKRHRRNAG